MSLKVLKNKQLCDLESKRLSRSTHPLSERLLNINVKYTDRVVSVVKRTDGHIDVSMSWLFGPRESLIVFLLTSCWQHGTVPRYRKLISVIVLVILFLEISILPPPLYRLWLSWERGDSWPWVRHSVPGALVWFNGEKWHHLHAPRLPPPFRPLMEGRSWWGALVNN